MSEPAAIDDHKLRRFIAAYKLRLAEKAAELGARQETWGRQNSISIEAEKKHLTQQDKYRIAPYPYPGLRAFDTEEGELFFGREQNVKALREILAKRRLVVVLGGSGSGKSSLVRAGLLPFLNTEHRIPGRDGNWYAVEFRPRTDPLGELSTALVSQLLVPFLKLGRKGLPEALGLSRDADVTSEGTIALLQERMRQRFVEAKKHSREKVLETLLQIVNNELDSYDDIATSGRRLADPNLFLLVDQLEEVFRPEVDDKQREALLDLIVDLHEHMKSATTKGGLFLAATIRSEEVHRCAEHRGLSEVVIGSGYQIEILDPSNKDDALALRRAIVAPARNVLEDWGFSVPADDEDAPFEKGLPELLLKGAARLSKELDHRPDQLPLLQHALQAVWHAAMRRWSKPDAQLSKLEISLDDLPGQAPEWYAADPNASLETRPVPDLSACLQARADKAGNRAAERFADATGTTPDVGNDALQGAFRALARRDDRGNWARRFAGREEITAFLNADPDSAVAQLPDDKKWQALRDALHVFQLRGYMSRGAERKYDISHEALIRNWPLFQAWLRAPEEVAYALGRVLMEVKPEDFNKASSKEQDKMIPDNLAERVEAVSEKGTLPAEWGQDQIKPYLLRPNLRRVWGGDKVKALEQMIGLARAAEKTREDAEKAKRQAETNAALEQAKREQEIRLEQAKREQEIRLEQAKREQELRLEQAKREQELRLEQAKREQKRRLSIAASAALVLLLAAGAAIQWNKLLAVEVQVKQTAAYGLIGSARADTNWPEGLRERVAIHITKMLSGEGKRADEHLVSESAWRGWDGAVRTILGDELRIGRLDHPPLNESAPACVTLGDDKKAPSKAVALSGFDNVEVRLQDAVDEAASGVRFETKEGHGGVWKKGDLIGNVNVSGGVRICLAPDGSSLTASYPGAGLPFMSELRWFRFCDGQVQCSSGRWRATSRPIKTILPPGVEGVTSFNCVHGIRAVPGQYLARIEVDFTAEADQCDLEAPGATTNKAPNSKYFRASYVPGLASAKAIAKVDLNFRPCALEAERIQCRLGPEDKLDSGPTLTLTKTPGLSATKTSGPSDVLWSMFAVPVPSYAMANVFVIAPTIVKAAIDGNNNIVLVDDNGAYWMVVNDRPKLMSELWRRADPLTNSDSWVRRPPLNVSINMDEKDLREAPPQ